MITEGTPHESVRVGDILGDGNTYWTGDELRARLAEAGYTIVKTSELKGLVAARIKAEAALLEIGRTAKINKNTKTPYVRIRSIIRAALGKQEGK